MLDIRLLGPPEITIDGSPLEVDTRKAVALLAYLAVEESATRDSLATLFWADSPSDRARATLRRTLSSLRTGIGDGVLAADRNTVTLLETQASDIHRFDAELSAADDHDHEPADVCGECIPPLTRVAELYRGDFLEGFSVRDAPEFEDWARTVTEGFRLRASGAFERLAMARAGDGDYAAAISAVNRWVELDQLHEPAHRLLMLLNGWAGDRPGAVEAYRSFVAVLDQELGVPPLEETTELYEAILDEDLPPAPGQRRRIRAQAAPPPESPGMINREPEVEALWTALAGSSANGKVVSLLGASWMGKTRLLDEFQLGIERDGVRVVVARSFRMDRTLPYGVATQILRGLMPAVDERELPEWAISEAARLDPGLFSSRERAGPEPMGELRLLEAIHAVLERAAEHGRLVIVVDDAQWTDPASARLIAYLGRRLSGLPVLLVVAARSGEELDLSIEELLGEADETIRLEPLQASDLSELCESPESAADLVGRTGGVPLLVQESLAGTLGSDSTVLRYAEERMREVGDLGSQVLAATAVLSGMCDASLLRETSGRGEEEIVQAVEQLVQVGLLRELSEGEGLTITLDSLADVIYDSTSLIRRRLLHRRAAEALRARPRAESDARVAAAIAFHLSGAGDPEAGGWYRLAGDLSREIYANEEAWDFYETAIGLGAEDVSSLRLGLGELAMTKGDYVAATQELTAAAARAEGPLLATIEHRLGEVQRLLGRFLLADEHFESSSELHPNPSELYADWALLRHRTGASSEASQLASRALEEARRQSDDSSIARALNIMGVVAQTPDVALSYLDDALEISRDDPLGRMAALNNKAHVLSQIGEPDAGIILVDEAIDIARRTGHRHREAALLDHLADLHHQAGRTPEAEAAVAQAVALFADVDAGAWEPEVWLLARW